MKSKYNSPELDVKKISSTDIMDGSDVDIDVKDLFEQADA